MTTISKEQQRTKPNCQPECCTDTVAEPEHSSAEAASIPPPEGLMPRPNKDGVVGTQASIDCELYEWHGVRVSLGPMEIAPWHGEIEVCIERASDSPEGRVEVEIRFPPGLEIGAGLRGAGDGIYLSGDADGLHLMAETMMRAFESAWRHGIMDEAGVSRRRGRVTPLARRKTRP